jgi:hypothetical protein
MARIPTREEREKCWKARDEYFKCCDTNGIWLDGISPSDKEIVEWDVTLKLSTPKGLSKEEKQRLFACQQLKLVFTKSCLSSWQQHFETERMKLKQKEFLIDKMKKEEMERNKSDDFWKRVRKD